MEQPSFFNMEILFFARVMFPALFEKGFSGKKNNTCNFDIYL